MTIWERIKNAIPQRKPKPRTRDEPGDTRMVGRARGDAAMLASESIFAANNRIATTLASMPLHLYRNEDVALDNPLERLVTYSPNEYMTGYLWLLTMQGAVGSEGNAYTLLVPSLDGTQPVRLDVLKPQMVTPYIERETGDLWYLVLDELEGTQYWVHSSRMIAIRFLGGNGARGLRPMDVLRGSLEYDAEIKRFSLEQLKSVSSAVMLTVPGAGLGNTEKDKLIEDFLDRYKRSGRSVMVLEGGLTAAALNKSPVDAKVMDVERITKNRVATVYGIPPHMLGDYSDTDYASAEQSMQEFLQLTMLGWVSQWEQELNRKLLTWDMVKGGLRWRFDMTSLIRADTATMANKHNLAIRGGWLTPNEVRRTEGMPSLPEGDQLLAARDLLPLKLIEAGKTITGKGA
ncbi:MAG: phage portal protein [Candidatus Limiplasma sp.]|nr:phage portal protein [Candidatus Limiplasma sp.]